MVVFGVASARSHVPHGPGQPEPCRCRLRAAGPEAAQGRGGTRGPAEGAGRRRGRAGLPAAAGREELGGDGRKPGGGGAAAVAALKPPGPGHGRRSRSAAAQDAGGGGGRLSTVRGGRGAAGGLRPGGCRPRSSAGLLGRLLRAARPGPGARSAGCCQRQVPAASPLLQAQGRGLLCNLLRSLSSSSKLLILL